jgi:hypothetical protein
MPDREHTMSVEQMSSLQMCDDTWSSAALGGSKGQLEEIDLMVTASSSSKRKEAKDFEGNMNQRDESERMM